VALIEDLEAPVAKRGAIRDKGRHEASLQISNIARGLVVCRAVSYSRNQLANATQRCGSYLGCT